MPRLSVCSPIGEGITSWRTSSARLPSTPSTSSAASKPKCWLMSWSICSRVMRIAVAPCLWKLCRFGVRVLGRERARERTQQRRPVALPGAAVHYREDERMLAGELLERGGGLRGVGGVVHLLRERLARAEDLALGEGAVDRLAHGEEVAAEERAGLELH